MFMRLQPLSFFKLDPFLLHVPAPAMLLVNVRIIIVSLNNRPLEDEFRTNLHHSEYGSNPRLNTIQLFEITIFYGTWKPKRQMSKLGFIDTLISQNNDNLMNNLQTENLVRSIIFLVKKKIGSCRISTKQKMTICN